MHKKLAYWLFACCFMIFMMATIGAVTRLTESGLSITEWKPVSGALPPLSAEAWQHEFDLYKQSPEFRARHFWMNLEDFKHIFFWEWLHRLWGRTIGLAFALPLLWFWWKKQIPPGYGARLCGLLALVSVEGLVGWLMVASGLVDRPSVSHFRLATHLALALTIYSATFWTALDLLAQTKHLHPGEGRGPCNGTTRTKNAVTERGALYDRVCRSVMLKHHMGPGLRRGGINNFGLGYKTHSLIALLLLALTIIWGAFTAGLHAGFEYNTFPLMNGRLTPDDPFSAAALATNPGWVQFTHRWLAKTTGLVIIAYAIRARAWPLGLMALVQIGLGIATLLSQVWLPLAALHQAGAIILLTILLYVIYKEPRTSIALE